MKQLVLIGKTDYTVLVKIRDDAGAPATGLDESDIDIAYARVETDNDVTTTDVTPAALSALTDAHTDWGFEEVSATDHPGLYRLDIADAVFASGAWSAVVTVTGTGLDPCDLEFLLVADDPHTALATAAELAKVPKSDGTATWNATALASIQAEANDAIVANHLDHLLAATYDPASKPGAADALLNELVESDGGVARFTANALEEGPSGGSAPTAGEIADAVWDEATAGHTTSGTFGEQLKTDVDAILDDTGTSGVALTAAERNSVADAIFVRNMSSMEASAPEHSLCTIVLAGLESAISGNTLTIKRTDGSTTHATKTLSKTPGDDPIRGIS